MTEEDRDSEKSRQISLRYRELGAEEPPSALDDAILAAATRSVRSSDRAARSAGSRFRAQRWALPLSLAAVVVLSVTVTLRIQHESPQIADPVSAVATAPVPSNQAPVPSNQAPVPPSQPPASSAQPRPAPAQKREQEKQSAPAKFAEALKPGGASAELSSRADEARRDTAASEGVASQSAPPALSKPSEMAAEAQPAIPPEAPVSPSAAAPRARVETPSVSGALDTGNRRDALRERPKKNETPEQALERIAKLRAEGRHDEADAALAEFRKRYPDFKIPPETLEKVLKK